MVPKERIERFDIARGIGILCVIIGHLPWFPVSNIIYTFHMPLFFIIGGYFLRKKGSLPDFCKGKAKRLLIPYYVIAVGLVLLKLFICGKQAAIQCIRQALYASGVDCNKTLSGVGQIGAIWFLWAMFWALLFVRITISIKKIGIRILIITALFGVSYFSAKFVWLPLDIQAGGCAAFYVYIGYLWHLYEGKMGKYLKWVPLAALLAVVYMVTVSVSINMVSCQYDYFIVSLLTSLLAASGVLWLSDIVTRKIPGNKFLLFCGRNSIIILGFHLIDLNNIDWSFVYEWFNGHNVPIVIQNVAMACVKIAFCVLLAYLFAKTREIIERMKINAT